MALRMGLAGVVAAALLLLLLLAGRADAAANIASPDFVDERVAGGFEVATDMCELPSKKGTKFIVLEKAGKVKLVENGKVKKQLVVDLRKRINSYIDRGLIGCAVDVRFNKGKRFIYLAYAVEAGGKLSGPKSGQVLRLKMNKSATKAIKGSGKVILGKKTPRGCRGVSLKSDVVCCDGLHCMGGLHMTKDGLLLVASGDGAISAEPNAWAMRSQNPHSLNGKILRITRDGLGVPSNPWFKRAKSRKSNIAKVVAIGTRNPWRLDYDDQLKQLVVTEVSWTNWEEINFIKLGKAVNAGWPCRFGDGERLAAWANWKQCKRYPEFGKDHRPVVSYKRDQAQALAGAVRVKFNSWPKAYRRAVFTADYSTGTLRYFNVNKQGKKQGGVPKLFASGLEGPVKIMEAPGGSEALWYLSLLSQQVRRIKYRPDKSAPKVTSRSPAGGKKGVETTTPIELKFSKRMDKKSVAKNFSLKRKGSNKKVPVAFRYYPETSTARFRPKRALNSRKRYTYTLGKRAKDTRGKRLKKKVKSSFTTGTDKTVFISDLKWPVAKSGWGPPERDMTAGTGAKRDGETISIRGKRFEKGVGVVADSLVKVNLPKGCKTFQAVVGVDDSATNVEGGWVHFEVLAGKKKVFDTSKKKVHGPPLTKGTRPIDVNVKVAGAKTVSLKVRATRNVDKRAYMRSSWGNARFRCGKSGGGGKGNGAPKVVSAKPKKGKKGVSTSSPAVSVKFSERMDLASLAHAVRLRRGGSEVGFNPVYNSAGTLLKLKVGELAPKTKYTLSVSKQATDKGGKALARRFKSSFRTKKKKGGKSAKPRCVISKVRDNFRVGSKIQYRGKGLDRRGRRLPNGALRWEVKQHHCPGQGQCHFHQLFTKRGAGGNFKVGDHGDYIFFEVSCKVCDGGKCSTSSVNSYPLTALVTVDSKPSGLKGGVGTVNGKFPLTQRVVVGSKVPLSVLRNQKPFKFKKWRHNGSKSPTTTVKIKGTGNKKYIAEFKR